MTMFNITALSPDNTTEVYSGVFCGEDEDDAVEALEEYLDKMHIEHGLCMVEEME